MYMLMHKDQNCKISKEKQIEIAAELGRPKIRTFFRINALFWPTDLPIPLNIPAK